MNVSVVNESLASVGADAVVVGVYAEEKKLRDPAGRVDQAAGGAVRHVLDAEKFQGKVGQVTHIHTNGTLPSRRVVVVGLGRRRDTTAESVRRAASAGVRRARDLGAKNVAIEVLGDRLPARQRAQSVVEGAILGTYTFDRYKREKTDKHVETLRLSEPDGRYRARGDRGRPARPDLRRGHVVRARPHQRAGQRRASHAPGRGGRRDRQGRRHQAAGAGPRRLREARHGRVSRRGRRQRAAAQVHPPVVDAVRPQPQEGRGHRQGHHVRLRRSRPQERRGHAAHEGRHVGGRRRARHHARAAGAQAAGRGPRAHRGHREHALRRGHPPGRRAAGDERHHHRDRQHRRRGAADAGRRHLLRHPEDQRRRDRGHGDPDRRLRGGAGAARLRPLRRTTTISPSGC